jgi:hypothetical protein
MEVEVRVLVAPVIDAVRNQLPLAGGAQIVVTGGHGLGGEGRASTGTMAQEFLLLRVARHHGIAGRRILASQACDVFALGVTVGLVAPRLFLARGTLAQFAFSQEASERAATRRRA